MFHSGMSFGSHTSTHRSLATLEKNEACKELTQSKQILEALLNQPVESIAYPGGSYNETILELAQAAGYKVGFSTVVGHNSRKTNLHIMKRIPVFNYSPPILRLIENAK
jgi:peptidoglycan/xylan/chitin deacetylase (PgdA/CDA1 family)